MATSSQKRNNLKVYGSLSIAVLVVSGLAFLWSQSVLGKAPSRLDAELKASQADGMAIDADELRSQFSVDENQNAAPFLGLAISQFKVWKSTAEGRTYSKLLGSTSKVSELKRSDIQALEPSLLTLSPVFDLLRQAAARPKLDFHRAWEKGPSLNLPELSEEKGCIVALVVQSKSFSAKGDVESATRILDLAAKLSKLTGQEPLIIGLLVQASMRDLIDSAVGELLRTHGTDRLTLMKCRTVLDDMGPQPDLLPALRSEFVMGRVATQMLATNRPELFGPDGATGAMKFARYGPVRTAFAWRYVQFYHHMYRDVRKAGKSILGIQRAFQDAQAVLSQSAGKDWTYGLTDLLSPVFVGMGDAIGESEARSDLLYCAIDLLDAKLKNGRFPDRLPGSSGYWLDPFTEKPFAYKPNAQGFLIYSFARDRMDNGGLRRENYSGENPYDIPFTYP